ncbi:zinc-binding dehydrogenase [uncultured Intestinimonas sp.]|uniref:zinc-binding dehydrogenase n=1 Tax=uncultured Intestinimonas sp. TaxID=1689265 RepID=UPI0025CCC2BF|nr:zinc-binding dehydrogenase [uncultured Intestinimonas sp.]
MSNALPENSLAFCPQKATHFTHFDKQIRLLNLRTGPNRAFSLWNHVSGPKRLLFTAAGAKCGRAASKQGKEYRFLLVHADGAQLQKITKLVERRRIVPKTDPRVFSLAEAGEALRLVAQGHTNGKVILRLE